MGFADPDELERLAAQIDQKAEDVRARKRAFDSQVAAVGWQSDGAQHYRTQCDDLSRDVEGNAQELNDAADDLRRHAQSVRDKLDWIDDMVDGLRDKAEEAWDDTKGAFEWGQDKLDDAKDKVFGWL